jgi:hypothetical protein
MDDDRFDDVARSLAASTISRRLAVRRLLASGPLPVLLSRLGLTEVAARCGNVGARCDRDRDCCDGRSCRRGRCRCRPGRETCGKLCCPSGQVCADGRCVPAAGSCPPGADTCIDPAIRCHGGDCSCLTAMTGETRCGGIISTPCGVCGEDVDCRRKYGAGTFCVKPGGNRCGCLPGQGFCARQCG